MLKLYDVLKKILLTLVLISCFYFCFSQTTLFKKSLLARFNFPGIIDPIDHNLSFGAEYIFHPKYSVGMDAAWIFASGYIYDDKRTNGILLRPFFRYYPHAQSNFFIEAEGHYKYASYSLEDWLGKEPENGVPAYQVFTKFQYIKQVAGIHILTGTRFYISKNHLLSMEATAGLGVRWKWQAAKNGIYRPAIFDVNLSGFTTVVPVNVRLCYSFK